MMEVTLNKSWHLWLANFGENRIDPVGGTDICEYTRAVLAGTFWASVVFVLGGLFLFWTGYTFYDVYQAIFNGVDMVPPTKIYLFLLGVLFLLVCAAVLKELWDNRPIKNTPSTPPSFAKVVYRKVKDKTCFRIKFNE